MPKRVDGDTVPLPGQITWAVQKKQHPRCAHACFSEKWFGKATVDGFCAGYADTISSRQRQNIGAGIHFEPGCYTTLSLGVLHPHSSESDLQEKLTFGERIGATIHAGIFSIMSDIRVEWQSKWARVEKYGRLLILFILFYLMNYITYYFSRKPIGPAPLVFHKPTDAPNAVCCVQFGQPRIELRLTSQTLVCAPWCILLPSQRK